MLENIHIKLNGKSMSIARQENRMLLWVLRTELGLTGTKYSCGEGLCGACTVLVDNESQRSCQFPLEKAHGKEILTIEGLQKNGNLHPLQTAFLQHNALQCGFCTPGMILTAYSLLQKNPRPKPEQVIQEMEDNLCRCGSYNRIIQAIQTAAQIIRGGRA